MVGAEPGVCQEVSSCDGRAIPGYCLGAADIQCCLDQTIETACSQLHACLASCAGDQICARSCSSETDNEVIETYMSLYYGYQANCVGRSSCNACRAEYTACGL
jgi:hypothetical protein